MRESLYGTQSYQKYEYDTYEVIPLQYLYKGMEMDYMRFPPEIEKPSGLRIMWVYSCSRVNIILGNWTLDYIWN